MRKAFSMQLQKKFEKLSDQELVKSIKIHSGSVDKSPKDLAMLKLEYSRRARDAKSISTLKIALIAIAQGTLGAVQFMMPGRNNSPPLFGEFELVKFLIVAPLMSLAIFVLWKVLIEHSKKSRRGNRPQSQNGFQIEEANPALGLSEKEAAELIRSTDKISNPEQYLLLKKEVSNVEPREHSRQTRHASSIFSAFYQTNEGNFAKESDFELKAMLKKLTPHDDPAIYGMIKLEFERRNPLMSAKEKFGYSALSLSIAGGLCSCLYFLMDVKLAVPAFLCLGAIGALAIYSLINAFERQRKAYFECLRNPNPVGFSLSPTDPVYEFNRHEFATVKNELYLNQSLTNTDRESLRGRTEALGIVIALGIVAVITLFVLILKY